MPILCHKFGVTSQSVKLIKYGTDYVKIYPKERRLNVAFVFIGVVQYLDHVEILGPNAVSHDLYLSNGVNQQPESGFQNGYNSCLPSSKNNDVDMHCDDIPETTNQMKSTNHYLNQPVRCQSLCGHLQWHNIKMAFIESSVYLFGCK